LLESDWNEAYERNYERVRRYVIYRLGKDRADDLTQHVFLKAYEHLPSFRQESQLLTWLLKIARNSIINDCKKAYRNKEMLLEPDVPCYVTSNFTTEVDFQVDIGAALKQQDLLTQEILTLRFVAELPFSEIANLLELSEGAVKNRLYRCLGDLKDELANWHTPAPLSPKRLFIIAGKLGTNSSSDAGDRALDDMLYTLQSNFYRITSKLNVTPTNKLTFEIFPSLEAFHQAAGVPNAPPHFNAYFGGSNRVRMVSPLNPGPVHSYESVRSSSLFMFAAWLTRQMNPQSPLWLYNGIGGYIGRATSRRTVSRNLSTIMQTGIFPTLNQINQVRGRDISEHIPVFALCNTVIDFIVTRYGLNTLQDLIRNPVDFEHIFGETLPEFEAEWIQFVKTTFKTEVSGAC
jgi:RNA polymerase sigma-70 factor (ECF subfamily)